MVAAPDELVPTLVEPTAQDMMAVANEVSEPIAAADDNESAADHSADETAEVADAKGVETQTTAVLDETKPADDKQQDINEDLERQ